MDIKYFGSPRIKLNRILPKEPNSCRISVYANAINHLLGTYTLTPEMVLQKINEKRVRDGKNPIALHAPDDFVHSSDLDEFVQTHYPQIFVKRIYGEKYVDVDIWKNLLSKGFVFSFYHQQLYDDFYETDSGEAFNYLDKYVLKECVTTKIFDYKKFKSFTDLLIRRNGSFDDGHTDLVLDVINEDGLPYVVFANLNSTKNSGLIKVPFKLLKYFGICDWEEGPAIRSSSEFPDEILFNGLREKGRLIYNGFNFVYGMQEIFCLKDRAPELNQILIPGKKSFPTPLLAVFLILLTPILMMFSDRSPKINTTSLDLNNPVAPKTEEEQLTEIINKNKPSTLEANIIGDDLCKVFSKESVAKIAEAKVSNAQNFAEAGAAWCEYTIEGQTQSTLTIYRGSVSASDEKASLTALGRIIKTLPDIKAKHFVVEDADGSLQAIYVVMSKNRFIRLDRTSRGMITDQILIDLANQLIGFQ